MYQAKAFFTGLVLVAIGVWFGDPVPSELSVHASGVVEFAENTGGGDIIPYCLYTSDSEY